MQRTMKRLLLTCLILMIIPIAGHAATRYVTNVACTGNYSVTNNNCSGTGSGLNSYTSVSAAYSASATGDTLRFRTGSYAANGQGPKASQIWEGCRAADCGTDNAVTLTTTGANVIAQSCGGPTGWTMRYLTLTGGSAHTIELEGVSGVTLSNLTITGWNTSLSGYNHGLFMGGYGTDDHTCPSINSTVNQVTAHDPAAGAPAESSALAFGDTSNVTVTNNIAYNAPQGIWFDTGPLAASTANLVQGNVVHDVTNICYHAEARTKWLFKQNLGYNCDEGMRIRPAATGGGQYMTGWQVYNNTIYAGNSPALWIPNEMGTEQFDNGTFKNNIFVNNSTAHPAVLLANPYATASTNTWQSNLIRNRGSGPAVCWNNNSGGFYDTCNGGTSYTNAQIANWNTANANVSGVEISSDPLFVNPGAGDFHLGSGSPAIDQGVDVGLAYNGAAPDLGALETGGGGVPALSPPTNLRVVSP